MKNYINELKKRAGIVESKTPIAENVRSSMTVGELIHLLEGLDPDENIYGGRWVGSSS